MEDSRYLQSIEPEEVAARKPELALIPGGQETAEQTTKKYMPFDEFMVGLGEEDWTNMNREQLMEIRSKLSAYWGETSARAIELHTDMGATQRKLIWLNGLIRKRE